MGVKAIGVECASKCVLKVGWVSCGRSNLPESWEGGGGGGGGDSVAGSPP